MCICHSRPPAKAVARTLKKVITNKQIFSTTLFHRGVKMGSLEDSQRQDTVTQQYPQSVLVTQMYTV